MSLRAWTGMSQGAWCMLIANFGMATNAQAKVHQSTMEDGKTVYEFKIDGIETESQVGSWGMHFTVVKLLGVDGHEGVIYKVGEPSLPVVRFYVESNEAITVLPGSDIEELPPLDNKVFPNQMSMAKTHQRPPIFSFNAQAYEEEEFIPNKTFTVEDAGRIRGVKRQLVTLYPYYYRPSSGEQRLRKSFKIVAKNVRKEVQRIANNETIVFVVGEKFKNSPALAKYRKLKEGFGYLTYVEGVSSIQNGTSEKIRNRLREYYNSKAHELKYVILVGDVDDVPAYKAEYLTQDSGSLWRFSDTISTDLPTDHYYRSLDSESYVDDVNGPDIAVGRISISSEAELDLVLRKYTRYQQADFHDDSWLKRATFVATTDEMFYEIVETTHDHVIEKITSKMGYAGIFPNNPARGGDKLYGVRHQANGTQLLAALNDGRGIVNYSGHGELTYWDSPEFSPEDLDKITHEDALPFVMSYACITGQFNIETSFAESWQRHPKGGVFFWGSVDSSYWSEDDRLQRKFYTMMERGDDLSIGTLTNTALAEVYRYYGGVGHSKYYWETYTSFGDPSLEIRSDRVRKAQLFVTRSPNAQTSLMVRNDLGAFVKHARLVVTLPNGGRYVTHTNEQGVAPFFVNSHFPKKRARAYVYVTGANLKPQSFSVELGGPKA